jgi:amino-acid N-acetyltransferase
MKLGETVDLGIALTQAHAHDLGPIHTLLASASLPYEDVTEELLQDFLVVRSESLIGVVGFERYQDVALLRSLAVAKEFGGRGLGQKLVAAAEKRAAEKQVKSLFLLTTTADRFFERLGYRRVPRDEAPPTIRNSNQFASLCPASAVLMVKLPLDGRSM